MAKVATRPRPEPTLTHEVAPSASGGRPPTLAQRIAARTPLLLVGFAVAFGAWLLHAELRGAALPNDDAVHAAMTRLAALNIRNGRNPFDAWFPYLGLGVPQFSQYQSLPSIITGFASIVFGAGTFRWTNYLLICTWPISVYIGARLLSFDRWEAAAASLFSPMLVSVKGYGFEWASFVWRGSGMWSMLWALWVMPVALGLSWRAVARNERVALAAFAVGLTCAFHLMTGLFVLLMVGVFVLISPSRAHRRVGRAVVVGLGGLLMFSFVFLLTLGDLDYLSPNSRMRGTFRANSFGPGHVVTWLFRGEVFDYGRAPVVSLFVALGVVACGLFWRRDEVARIPVGLMVLSLLLYSGRRVVGPAINHVPGGNAILMYRFIIGVHFAGMLLAGLGAVWVFRLSLRLGRHVLQFDGREVVVVGIASLVAFVVLCPALLNRKHYADSNTASVDNQIVADRTDGADVTALINIAKARNDGRIYAGSSTNWGASTRVDQVPNYELSAQLDADSLGSYLLTDSLSSDIEPHFDESDLAQYDIFNVKYLVLPTARRPRVRATPLTTQGDYTLWQVETSGYLEVVDTTEVVRAERADLAAMFERFVASPGLAQRRVPLISFDGEPTGTPSSSVNAPYTGPPGSVDRTDATLVDGRFTGRIHTTRPAWVMLKESYCPRWTATVDGKPVQTQMLAPSFVGVPVPAGDHIVAFEYRPRSSYPASFALGAFVLLVIALGPMLWRRWSARRKSRTPIPG